MEAVLLYLAIWLPCAIITGYILSIREAGTGSKNTALIEEMYPNSEPKRRIWAWVFIAGAVLVVGSVVLVVAIAIVAFLCEIIYHEGLAAVPRNMGFIRRLERAWGITKPDLEE